MSHDIQVGKKIVSLSCLTTTEREKYTNLFINLKLVLWKLVVDTKESASECEELRYRKQDVGRHVVVFLNGHRSECQRCCRYEGRCAYSFFKVALVHGLDICWTKFNRRNIFNCKWDSPTG